MHVIAILLRMKNALLFACMLLFCVAWGLALQTHPQATAPSPQNPNSATAPQASPNASHAATKSSATARPGDVDSIEHILAAVYDVISGPAGKRDWDRFRSLFYPGARLIPTRRDPKGAASARVLTPDEYAQRGQAFFDREGFFERSVANRIESWDSIAHVWSTYESRHTKDDPRPFARGINSFQLFNDGSRWWIMSIYWEAEDSTHPLPEKYTK